MADKDKGSVKDTDIDKSVDEIVFGSPDHNSTTSTELNQLREIFREELKLWKEEQKQWRENVEASVNSKIETERQQLEAKIAENKREITINQSKIVDSRVESSQDQLKRIAEVESRTKTNMLEVQRTLESQINQITIVQNTALEATRNGLTTEFNLLRQNLNEANETSRFTVEELLSTFHSQIENQKKMFDEQVQKHDEQKRELENKLRRLEEQTVRRQIGVGSYVQATPSWERDVKIPSYDGTFKEKPMSFLHQLEKFCESRGMNENEISRMIRQSLGGIAQEWWEIVGEPDDKFVDFKRKFERKFWSEETQRKVKKNLEFGSYRHDSHETRVEYAIRRFRSAKDLKPTIPDHEIVECLSRHFDDTIQSAVLTRGIGDIQALISLLEKFDNARRPNQAKDSVPTERTQQSNRSELESQRVQGDPRIQNKPVSNPSAAYNMYRGQQTRPQNHTQSFGAKPKPFDTEHRNNAPRQFNNSHIQVEDVTPINNQSFELPKLGN